MSARIEPQPTPEERELILAALGPAPVDEAGWAAAALAEGVGQDDPEP